MDGKERLAEMTLGDKITLAQIRIRQWYDHWDGKVSVSFSGGLDSTVLLHLVREIYPEVPGVFADTGLEYPEIRDFVKSVDNMVWLKPKMPFKDVIKIHGYPVISKETAQKLRVLQNPTAGNVALRERYMTGIAKNGRHHRNKKLADKWMYLINADFKISERCCKALKTGPLQHHTKQSGLMPYVGIRSTEGGQRLQSLAKFGCNLYEARHPRSAPLSKWTDQDVRGYIQLHNLLYSKIYDMGEKRTGCMFCAFGAHLEPGENRFQRMARTHPRHYRTCMDKLGMRKVLGHIGVDVNPLPEQLVLNFETEAA
ncbi:MAG: phosphoadenosine phosphosulfate reductase family protein [Magnetococcales bacterium]|nr:phosphoadenosine phosphosulfate reductase family protein [Magnetococcales bacterium]